MKNLILIFALFLMTTVTAFAQLDIKVAPIASLFYKPTITLEKAIKNNIAVEATMKVFTGKVWYNPDIRKNGVRLQAVGKYYFNSTLGYDGFYVGLYGGTTVKDINGSSEFIIQNRNVTTLNMGIAGGYKWVGDNGIIFEVGGGFGRTFYDADNIFDLFSTLSVGYRF